MYLEDLTLYLIHWKFAEMLWSKTRLDPQRFGMLLIHVKQTIARAARYNVRSIAHAHTQSRSISSN